MTTRKTTDPVLLNASQFFSQLADALVDGTSEGFLKHAEIFEPYLPALDACPCCHREQARDPLDGLLLLLYNLRNQARHTPNRKRQTLAGPRAKGRAEAAHRKALCARGAA